MKTAQSGGHEGSAAGDGLSTDPSHHRTAAALIALVHRTEMGQPPDELPEAARQARRSVMDGNGLTSEASITSFSALGCGLVVAAADERGIPDEMLALLLGLVDESSRQTNEVIRAIKAHRRGPSAFDGFIAPVSLEDRRRLAMGVFDLYGRIVLVGWASV